MKMISVGKLTQKHFRSARFSDNSLSLQSVLVSAQNITQVLHCAIEHQVLRPRYMWCDKDTWLRQRLIPFAHRFNDILRG